MRESFGPLEQALHEAQHFGDRRRPGVHCVADGAKFREFSSYDLSLPPGFLRSPLLLAERFVGRSLIVMVGGRDQSRCLSTDMVNPRRRREGRLNAEGGGSTGIFEAICPVDRRRLDGFAAVVTRKYFAESIVLSSDAISTAF